MNLYNGGIEVFFVFVLFCLTNIHIVSKKVVICLHSLVLKKLGINQCEQSGSGL